MNKPAPVTLSTKGLPPALLLLGCITLAVVVAYGLFHFSTRSAENLAPSFEFLPTANMTTVEAVDFHDTVVPLDGFEYRNCEFYNVVFKYNGTTPVRFKDNLIRGPFSLTTDNPSISIALGMASALGLLPGPPPPPAETAAVPLPGANTGFNVRSF